MWSFAQQVAKKLEKAYPEKRVTIAVVGIEVPHAHIHLVPISGISELNFGNQRLAFTPEQYSEIQQKIAVQ